MKRVLLAVDDSPHALEAAHAIACLSRTDTLIAVHVVKLSDQTSLAGYDQAFWDEMKARLQQEGKAALDRATAILASNVGTIMPRTLNGPPSESIIKTADEEQADLIVMGARGVSQVEALVLGSVSHSVITHAHCPTLVVKQPFTSLKRILLPLEGPEDAEAAEQFLSKMPFKDPIDLLVLNVPPLNRPIWPVEVPVDEPHVKMALEHAREFVDSVSSKFSALGYHAEGLLAMGIPAMVIIQQALEHRVDMILMGSHGRHGIRRLALGSVSHTVLYKSSCPVLTFRVQET